jgi:3'-phosphoadenosine 5'-phosphosulfate sulfotransferase
MDTSRHVTVVGTVVRVRRYSGGWRIRLADTGGMLAAAEIRFSSRLALPRVGARILIHGRLRYDEQHGWHTVDPVEEWREAPEP